MIIKLAQMDVYTLKNPLQACLDVLFKPNKVFAALSEKNNWSWVPFILVSLLTSLPMFWYFNTVDMAWLVQLQVDTLLGDVSPAERQDLTNILSAQNQNPVFTMIGMIGGLLITNAFLALYLKMTTKSDEFNVNDFSDWYGFTWWTQLPVVITAISICLVLLFTSSDQISPGDLNFTSLSFWLGLDFSSKWFALAQSIKLETAWSIYLVATGLNQWTRLSPKRTMLIAAGPYGVILACWALFLIAF